MAEEAPTPSAGPEPTGRRGWYIVGGAAVLVSAVAVVFGSTGGKATGSIRAAGLPHGDFVVEPVTCFTGTHWDFDGVSIVTEPGEEGERRGFKGGLKLVKAGQDEWVAHVENPTRCEVFKCEQRVLERQYCRTFDVALRDSFARGPAGHAKMACVFPQGGTVDVDVTFADCTGVPSDNP